ncbi:MAG: hypothetical protein ABJH20_19670 [Rhizobiaceae bacterium]
MTRLILALIRTIALALSFILSSLAAAVFVSFALFLGGDTEWLRHDPQVAVGTIGFALAVWFEIARALFVPFILFVLVAEPARLSGLIANLLIGGSFALVYMVMTGPAIDMPYTHQEVWIAALAAGFVGGLAHWLLAGHRAGRWMGPAKSADPVSQ